MKNTKKMVFLGILLAQALVLHYIESFIPVPVPAPGVKLGLANIITMITIVVFGFKETMVLVVLRSFMGSIFGGVISSFLFSVAGGVLSALIMYYMHYYHKNTFSLMGISIVGAISHNIGQLLVASLIVSNFGIFTYLPVLMLSAVIIGYFVGLATKYVLKILSPNLKYFIKENA